MCGPFINDITAKNAHLTPRYVTFTDPPPQCHTFFYFGCKNIYEFLKIRWSIKKGLSTCFSAFKRNLDPCSAKNPHVLPHTIALQNSQFLS